MDVLSSPHTNTFVKVHEPLSRAGLLSLPPLFSSLVSLSLFSNRHSKTSKQLSAQHRETHNKQFFSSLPLFFPLHSSFFDHIHAQHTDNTHAQSQGVSRCLVLHLPLPLPSRLFLPFLLFPLFTFLLPYPSSIASFYPSFVFTLLFSLSLLAPPLPPPCKDVGHAPQGQWTKTEKSQEQRRIIQKQSTRVTLLNFFLSSTN